MPHFTLSVGADGPMLTAFVTVSEGRLAALQKAGVAVPGPVKIRALVDTGASCTCVEPTILTGDLGLTLTGQTRVITAGGKPELRDEYDVGLMIPGADKNHVPMLLRTIRVVATSLKAEQGFDALIGRDILRNCVLTYNGSIAFFTLAY